MNAAPGAFAETVLMPGDPLRAQYIAENWLEDPERVTDAEARAEIEQLVRQVEKVETAVEPRFQAHFVEAMAIPHKTAPYPLLAKAVALPVRAAGAEPKRGRRGGRRRPARAQ